ncbi:hypothetical protein C2W62_49665, partial [Candidatus Entotheonella serta]
MIRETLVFLRDELNAYLNEQAGRPTDSPEYMAVFVDSQDTQRDVIAFPPNAVTVMLINVEEERALRAPDRYRQRLDHLYESSITGFFSGICYLADTLRTYIMA